MREELKPFKRKKLPKGSPCACSAKNHRGSPDRLGAGGRRYATQVSFEGGDLESVCDCPLGGTCKHAVAVVIENLEAVKKGRTVPPAEARDERLEILENTEDEEWEEYLSGLGKANERKRRLIEILDGFQGSWIIDGHSGNIGAARAKLGSDSFVESLVVSARHETRTLLIRL